MIKYYINSLLILFLFSFLSNLIAINDDFIIHRNIPCKLQVTCGGNLGNAIESQIIGYYTGKFLSTKINIHNCHGFNDEHKTTNEFDFGSSSNIYYPTCYETDNINAYESKWDMLYPGPSPNDYRIVARELYDNLYKFKIIENHIYLMSTDDDVLTIYLRGLTNEGLGNMPERYVQAPCSFFTKVVLENHYKRILIVTSTTGIMSHPCLHIIPHSFNGAIETYIHIGSVAESFTLLAHSKNIAISSLSTYSHSAILLNPQLQKVYLPVCNNTEGEVMSYWMRRLLTLDSFGIQLYPYIVQNFPNTKWDMEAFNRINETNFLISSYNFKDEIIYENLKRISLVLISTLYLENEDDIIKEINNIQQLLYDSNKEFFSTWKPRTPWGNADGIHYAPSIILTCSLDSNQIHNLQLSKQIIIRKFLTTYIQIPTSHSLCQEKQISLNTNYDDIIKYIKDMNPFQSLRLLLLKQLSINISKNEAKIITANVFLQNLDHDDMNAIFTIENM